MKMPEEIKRKRDELAEHLDKTSSLHNVMGYSHSRAFRDGFDAGYAAQISENENAIDDAKRFARALEVYAMADQTFPEFKHLASMALTPELRKKYL